MKKIFLLVSILLVCIASFAAPNPKTITMLHTGDTKLGDTTMFAIALDDFHKDFPEVKVEMLKVDLSDGSTLTMDAMLAAGNAPNIYVDTMVRIAKYMVPEYALPLDSFIRDLNKYSASTLLPYRTNGKLLALPQYGGAQGMCINLDIMKDIGYVVPKDWTIDDFLVMAKKVKDKYNGKKWATGMFAANQSGDYLLNNWFASFGIPNFYEPGNYDKSIVSKVGGEKVYAFYQLLAKEGFIPPNSATLNDDDYAAQWMVGDLAATAFFPNWTAVYFKTAIDQGLIKKPFEYIFVPFPRASGVKKVPTYFSNGAFLVHKTGTDSDKYASRLVEYLNSAKIQDLMCKQTNTIPSRIDVVGSNDVHIGEVMKILSENGIMDVGLTDPRFTERRALQYPILQKVLMLEKSPKDAINEFEAKLSSVKK